MAVLARHAGRSAGASLPVSARVVPLRIAVLAKAPVPGQAKTRLIPALGATRAALLAETMLLHTAAQAVAAAAAGVTVWAAPDARHPAFVQLQAMHGVALEVQPEGDLGLRMAKAFEHAFDRGPGPVLLIGSDCPALDAGVMREAAKALREQAAVFVPALDGGYALVGLRAAPAGLLQALFAGMVWSTPRVMADTRARLAAAGVAHAELPALPDIDEPADLAHLPPGWPAVAGGA